MPMSLRPRALVAFLGAAVASCSDREPEFQAAVLPLVDRPALVEVEMPLPVLPSVTGVEWLREGLAGLVVEVSSTSGVSGEASGLRLVRFPLPLPVADTHAGASAQPVLVGLPIPRYVAGMEPTAEQTSGFWVHGSELAIVHPVGETLPETITLQYPVYAALLADTALAAGFAYEDVHTLRRARDNTSVESIAVATGSKLVMKLPPLPDGWLEGAFSALSPQSVDPDALDDGPEVVLSIDGEEIARQRVSIDGLPTAIGAFGDERTPLEESLTERILEFEVRGEPGTVAFLEGPFWVRGRTWRDHPNVLLVIVDTLRADRLGVHGNRENLTPALDAFANESIRFDQAWATSSWTLPSVATMLTSNHGAQHQAWLNDKRLGRGLTTLAEAYREEGYRTAAFTGGGFVAPSFGLDRGFMHFDATGGGVEAVLERGRAFLDKAGTGPWFLLLHTYEVHAPYEPPEEAAAAVERRHPNGLKGQTAEPHNFYPLAAGGQKIPDEIVATLSELYDEEIRYTDAKLGEFFDELRDRGLFDAAVICVTSDHGEEFGEHGLLGHGDTLYVEQLHVPLLLKLPEGESAGQVKETPVSLLDLAPTLLQSAELEPKIRDTTFVGRPLLAGQRSRIYAVRNHAEVGLLQAARSGQSAFIAGRYYYPAPRVRGGTELYNLSVDPQQRNPEFSRKERRTMNQMTGLLKSLREQYGDVRVEDSDASIDASQAIELKKLGYGY